jgi:mannose/fructose/N-acetylgalactosamine-specific phosphotransferase system component IIB
MDIKKNHSNQISHSINLADEDLIAVSQIEQDHSKVHEKDLAHQIASNTSISDQNIENLEKLNFTH